MVSLSELFASVPDARHRLQVMRKAYGSPRTTCFNVHGFRIAVHRITGEIRILQSVHAADAGVILNPMQCRGQVEGAVAQGIGSSLFERMVFDASGKMLNPTFRNYRISAFADIPRTEVFFADTYDAYGPLGAKSAVKPRLFPSPRPLAMLAVDGDSFRQSALQRGSIFGRRGGQKRSPTQIPVSPTPSYRYCENSSWLEMPLRLAGPHSANLQIPGSSAAT
jgi:hypothetical protein